jgi:hypothetical protein
MPGPAPALEVALDGIAGQPEHRGPEPDEDRAALGVAALVLVHGLGADPEDDAEHHGPERGAVQLGGAEVETGSRSGDRLSWVLHDSIHMAKEVQLHMWTSVIERVVRLAHGRLDGGIDIETRRLELPDWLSG